MIFFPFLKEEIKIGIWGARNVVSANDSFKVQSFSLETTPLVKKTT